MWDCENIQAQKGKITRLFYPSDATDNSSIFQSIVISLMGPISKTIPFDRIWKTLNEDCILRKYEVILL